MEIKLYLKVSLNSYSNFIIGHSRMMWQRKMKREHSVVSVFALIICSSIFQVVNTCNLNIFVLCHYTAVLNCRHNMINHKRNPKDKQNIRNASNPVKFYCSTNYML